MGGKTLTAEDVADKPPVKTIYCSDCGGYIGMYRVPVEANYFRCSSCIVGTTNLHAVIRTTKE